MRCFPIEKVCVVVVFVWSELSLLMVSMILFLLPLSYLEVG